MPQTMAAALWPAGIAFIACLGALLVGRLPGTPPAPAPGPAARPQPARTLPGARRPATAGLARFLLVLIAGAAVIYALMVPLGLLVAHAGPAVDKPVFHWMARHRIRGWMDMMKRVTQLGDTYPAVFTAGTAATCLAVAWRRAKWLPPVALGCLGTVLSLLTGAIDHTVHRAPPPGSTGTFPSGGVAVVVACYGLIAYLLWREFSGRRKAAVWAMAAVAALGFSEAYSRAYLGAHWFTDILSGMLYGCLVLALCIAAVHAAIGPPGVLAPRPAPPVLADPVRASPPAGRPRA